MALLPSEGLIIAFCIFTLHFASWIPSGGRKRDGAKEEKKARSRTLFFYSTSSFSAPPPHVHLIIPPLPLQGCFPPLPLPSAFGENQSLNWKRDPGATDAGLTFLSPPLFALPSFWIIDSCCLVIHRLHMPANSSGGGKLPSPATLRSTPNTHATNHASRRALSHTCVHAQTLAPQVWVKPRHIHHHHLHHHWPLKSQELGMRRGSKRHVSR